MHIYGGAVKLMRTHIGFLAQPESMRSTISAANREQRLGSALNRGVSKSGASLPPHSQPSPTPSMCSALSGPEWPQRESSIP